MRLERTNAPRNVELTKKTANTTQLVQGRPAMAVRLGRLLFPGT